MAGHGARETERLKKNLKAQLQRLLTQLQDIEELRDELEDVEYEEVKADTLEQMEEIDEQLRQMMAGNVSLVTELGSMKLAVQAAIKKAFKTPEVIRLFAQKEPAALRARLSGLQEDKKLGRITAAAFASQAAEIIAALQKLGEELQPEERGFLESDASVMQQFQTATSAIGEQGVISRAGTDVKAAQAAAGGATQP